MRIDSSNSNTRFSTSLTLFKELHTNTFKRSILPNVFRFFSSTESETFEYGVQLSDVFIPKRLGVNSFNPSALPSV